MPIPEPPRASFASDNASGIHPAVLEALVAANDGHALAYGDDPWTRRAESALRDAFAAPDATVLFCWGGTGANVVALQCALAPHQAVLCADTAHIHVDECGAPERFTGSKLLVAPTDDGKLRPEQVLDHLGGQGDQHHVQLRVVSVTQATELGTCYSPDELAALCDVAHAHDLVVHVDGARLANAAAALGTDLADLTTRAGVDLVSFGGTKNGLAYGEAVVVLRPDLARHARFIRKQAAQLPSKLRFVAAQFEALLADDLWRTNAAHANAMATLLADRIREVPAVTLARQPEVNSVFATIPRDRLDALRAWSFFWTWDEPAGLVRWMTSFDTTADDVDAFAAGVAAHLA